MAEQKKIGRGQKAPREQEECPEKVGIKVVKMLRQRLFHTHFAAVDSTMNSNTTQCEELMLQRKETRGSRRWMNCQGKAREKVRKKRKNRDHILKMKLEYQLLQ
ncbi:hypothetical protein GOODEAATRI_025174 [Goodea atripinnis]|uniref:Uncharacterized protein n=1 Tax=Goodea atripinnis TaxID=208336 RepID=A0ABV0NN09_9TELE